MQAKKLSFSAYSEIPSKGVSQVEFGRAEVVSGILRSSDIPF